MYGCFSGTKLHDHNKEVTVLRRWLWGFYCNCFLYPLVHFCAELWSDKTISSCSNHQTWLLYLSGQQKENDTLEVRLTISAFTDMAIYFSKTCLCRVKHFVYKKSITHHSVVINSQEHFSIEYCKTNIIPIT